VLLAWSLVAQSLICCCCCRCCCCYCYCCGCYFMLWKHRFMFWTMVVGALRPQRLAITICSLRTWLAWVVKQAEMAGNCSSMTNISRDTAAGRSIDMTAIAKDICDAGACRSAAMEANVTCSGTAMGPAIGSFLILCSPCEQSQGFLPAVFGNCTSVSSSTSTTSHSLTQLLILSTLGVAGAVAALQ
ncbi:unnamed protein product, partial [Polarella glacialis]